MYNLEGHSKSCIPIAPRLVHVDSWLLSVHFGQLHDVGTVQTANLNFLPCINTQITSV